MGTRNWDAVSATFRQSGFMDHKNLPRGGARNLSRDFFHSSLEDEEGMDFSQEELSTESPLEDDCYD